MKVSKIVDALEQIAPPELAAGWDNVGLLVGDRRADTRCLMLCIDLTEQALAEAVRAGAKMVMAYHPVVFKSVSRVTAADEPVVYGAASKGVAVYCMHTALDAAPGGTNDVLAEVLGLVDVRPIEPVVRAGGYKVVVFAPAGELEEVADAAFQAGAGRIGNYERCSFSSRGVGTFRGMGGSKPTIGRAGRDEMAEELRLEMVAPTSKLTDVCSAIRKVHSYEEPAIDIYPVHDAPEATGMGRIGRLPRAVTAATLVRRIKKRTGLTNVLVAAAEGNAGARQLAKPVSVAACCAGSCGDMYKSAAAGGATFHLTGEMRHHDALAATAMGLDVVCLGHSNSERITLRRVAERLGEVMPKLKVVLARSDRDPFQVV